MKGAIVFLVFVSLCINVVHAQDLYWTDDENKVVRSAPADGSGPVTTIYTLPVIISNSLPGGIKYDAHTDKLYFGHNSGRKVQRMNLDGSSLEDLTPFQAKGPGGIGVDASNIYFSTENAIFKGGKSGSTNPSLLVSTSQFGLGVDIDQTNNVVYYSYGFGTGSDGIGRINTDGTSSNASLISLGSNAPSAIRVAGNFIYWIEFNTNKVRRADLNGSNVVDLVTTGLNQPRSIAIDESSGFIYIGNFGNKTISRAPLTGGAATTLYNANVGWTVNLTVKGSAASNAAPTASSFTALSGPFEDLVYTFSTSDFGYSDGDSDPLDHVLIEAIPGAGTLFLDADNDDTFDAGEALSVNAEVSKANLDAGNLQYIQTGSSTNTSFQFEVNDGTNDSSGNYVATLNVIGKPTVTLSQTNASLSEANTSTTGTVTATLSNAYGATVTVNLSTSGATVNSDFTISSTAITINAGVTTGNATITILDDSDLEDTETLIVAISSVTNGTENGVQSKDFTIANNDFALSIKVFLEGPLSGTTMSTGLNSSLPTAQPYAGATAETSAGIPVTAVDWVEVELRSGTASGTRVGTNRAGILKSDGTIVDKDGAAFTMPQADGSDYYLVIHHRNHLSVMSASAVSASGGVYTYDFTTSQAQNFNNGADGAIQVGSVFAMMAGDENSDSVINSTDLSSWRSQNGTTFSYAGSKADFNLDGAVNAVDRNDFQQKNNSKSSQVPTT